MFLKSEFPRNVGIFKDGLTGYQLVVVFATANFQSSVSGTSINHIRISDNKGFLKLVPKKPNEVDGYRFRNYQVTLQT